MLGGWGQNGKEGCAYVGPTPGRTVTQGQLLRLLTHPPQDSSALAACLPSPFTSPLSHTGCQEVEDLRIQALPQPLPLALCPAGSSTAKDTTAPLL